MSSTEPAKSSGIKKVFIRVSAYHAARFDRKKASNLDAQLRMELRAEIKSLHQRFKITMMYVTHDFVQTSHAVHPPTLLKVLEVTGESSQLHAEWQGFPLHIQFAGRLALKPLQPIALEKIHLFDAQSGTRLV